MFTKCRGILLVPVYILVIILFTTPVNALDANIDPELVYSSFLGAVGFDEGCDIATDGARGVWVVGSTTSTEFPIMNAYQSNMGGGCDAFISHFSSTGALLYSTYLGPGEGRGITSDGSGGVWVTGLTGSTEFPVLNAYQITNAGNADAFISHFSSTGALIYSSYLGGNGFDTGWDITSDGSGGVWIAGRTESPEFPVMNAYLEGYSGNSDIFVTHFSSTGLLISSTYLGGSEYDHYPSIAPDGNGGVWVTAMTESPDFPVLNAYQYSYKGERDAFITHFSSTGALLSSTYLGGSDNDYGNALASDGLGGVWVTAGTWSTDFPVTDGAYQNNYGGNADAFVSHFSSTGALLYSTYLGGVARDEGFGLAVDGNGGVWITGNTDSSDFPILNAYQNSYAGNGDSGNSDAFVSHLSSTGNLLASTYLGGSSPDHGRALTANDNGEIWVTGRTDSPDFPILNAYQSSYGGGGSVDAFITKFSDVCGEPTINNLNPYTIAAGSDAFILFINGTNFVDGSTIYWEGYERSTIYISETQLNATILKEDVAISGMYKVKVVNPDGSESNEVNFIVQEDVDLIAEFTASVGSGPAPLNVTFYDQSDGNPTSWLWEFGDGVTTNEQNPTHVYNSIGEYTVNLTVYSNSFENTTSKYQFICVVYDVTGDYLRIEQAVQWALDRVGPTTEYADHSLKFINAAYNNGSNAQIDIGIDSYDDLLNAISRLNQNTTPPRGSYVFYSENPSPAIALSLGNGEIIHVTADMVEITQYLDHPGYAGWAWPPISAPVILYPLNGSVVNETPEIVLKNSIWTDRDSSEQYEIVVEDIELPLNVLQSKTIFSSNQASLIDAFNGIWRTLTGTLSEGMKKVSIFRINKDRERISETQVVVTVKPDESNQPLFEAPWYGKANITQGNFGTDSHNDGFNNYALDIGIGGESFNVLCPADGWIVESMDNGERGEGNFIIIKHNSTSVDYYTWYLHLNERKKNVTDGFVKKGELIGISGETGNSKGIHLHFMLSKTTTYMSEPFERLRLKNVTPGSIDNFYEYNASKGELDDTKVGGYTFLSDNRLLDPHTDDLIISAPHPIAENGGIIIPISDFPEGNGENIPIYVPKYDQNTRTNTLQENDDWTTIKIINKYHAKVDPFGFLVNFELGPPDLGVKMSLLSGLIRGVAGGLTIADIQITIQQNEEGQCRAIIELGDPKTSISDTGDILYGETFIRRYAGSSFNTLGKIDFINKQISDELEELFRLEELDASYERYYFEISLNETHKKDVYIGYLSAIDDSIMFTPKVYPDDEISIRRKGLVFSEEVVTYRGNQYISFFYSQVDKSLLYSLSPVISKDEGAVIRVHSPVDFYILDNSGRITGMNNGIIYEEIPYSVYLNNNKTVVLFKLLNNYSIRVNGNSDGSYGLEIRESKPNNDNWILLDNINIKENDTHFFDDIDIQFSNGTEIFTFGIDSSHDNNIDTNVTVNSLILPINASFESNPNNGHAPLLVNFYDTTNVTSTNRIWYVEDSIISNDINCSHVFNISGLYEVILSIETDYGVLSSSQVIQVLPPQFTLFGNATLYGNPTPAGSQVTATTAGINQSVNINSPGWYGESEIGKGFVLSGDIPTGTPITFTIGGLQARCGIVNEAGTAWFDSYPFFPNSAINLDLDVPATITADFSGTPTTGYAPLEVMFMDNSTGDPFEMEWEFGDGSSSETDQDTINHTYTTPGTYTVTFEAMRASASDTELKIDYITVITRPPPPIANFTASPVKGPVPLQVTFHDHSTGGPDTYLWNFGDGVSSPDLNPVHTYSKQGIYTVTLSVENEVGNDSIQKSGYITVEGPIKALPGLKKLPRDLDGDGTYEDLDGNGKVNMNDLILFARYFQWIKRNEPGSAFDFNHNGKLEFDDFLGLLQYVTKPRR